MRNGRHNNDKAASSNASLKSVLSSRTRKEAETAVSTIKFALTWLEHERWVAEAKVVTQAETSARKS